MHFECSQKQLQNYSIGMETNMDNAGKDEHVDTVSDDDEDDVGGR